MYDAAVSRVVRWDLGDLQGVHPDRWAWTRAYQTKVAKTRQSLYFSRLFISILFTTSDLSHLTLRDSSLIAPPLVWERLIHIRFSPPRWGESGLKRRTASRGFGPGKSSPQRLDSRALYRANNLPDPRTLDLWSRMALTWRWGPDAVDTRTASRSNEAKRLDAVYDITCSDHRWPLQGQAEGNRRTVESTTARCSVARRSDDSSGHATGFSGSEQPHSQPISKRPCGWWATVNDLQ